MLISSVEAASSGQFCIKNHTTDSYFALFTNVSVGVKFFKNRQPVIESTGGDPVHVYWGDEYCVNASIGDTVRIYRKSLFSGWEYRRSYNMKWLSGLDLYLGKAGRLDTEMGYSLKYEAGESDTYDPRLWMSQLFSSEGSDAKLRELCIPGTHASGSYQNHQPMTVDPYMSSRLKSLSDRFTNSKINTGGFAEKKQGKEYYLDWWVKTQSKNITQQLELGARYLGVKVVSLDGQFFTARGLIGAPVDSVLDQVKGFLDNNADEIVMLHFYDTRSLNQSQHQLLFERIEEKLGGLLVPGQMGADVTVDSIYQTPYRVVILYQPSRYNAPEWLWEDSKFTKLFHVSTGDPNLFLKNMQRQYGMIKPSSAFEVTDMYLTPSSADFDAIGSSFTLNWGKDFAGTLKYLSGITQYLSQAAITVNRHLNVVSHDYIEDGDLFTSCMVLNQRLINGEPDKSVEPADPSPLSYDESEEAEEQAPERDIEEQKKRNDEASSEEQLPPVEQPAEKTAESGVENETIVPLESEQSQGDPAPETKNSEARQPSSSSEASVVPEEDEILVEAELPEESNEKTSVDGDNTSSKPEASSVSEEDNEDVNESEDKFDSEGGDDQVQKENLGDDS